jgi:hypothetical protein
MSKRRYFVDFTVSNTYGVEVEANDENDAENIVRKMIEEKSPDDFAEHHGGENPQYIEATLIQDKD